VIPVKFKESNRILVADRCGDLYVFTNGVEVVSCWKMSFKDRVLALLLGRVWMNLYTGSTTQPPAWLSVERSAFQKSRLEDKQ
jgi:hypothetical protein